MIYYYKISLTNLGSKPTTFLGFFNEKSLYTVSAIKNQKFLDTPIPYKLYFEDNINFSEVINTKDNLNRLKNKSWEEIGNLNVKIDGGETKTISLIFNIINKNIKADAFYINIMLRFNNG